MYIIDKKQKFCSVYPYEIATKGCFFRVMLCSLRKTLFAMNRTELDYAAFERMMDEERIFSKVDDFSGICALIGADPVPLDKMIYDELGWRGQELVDFYRSSENIH